MDTRVLLVIDDEESIHKLLGDFLPSRGYMVHSAYTGPDGLDILRKQGTPVVLTDVRIPGMDGLDVLKAIKEYDPSIQVVVMTAANDKNIAVEALRLGADDYLEKPFRLAELEDVLERSENRRRVNLLARRWQQLVEHLPVGLIWCSAEGTVEDITPAARELLPCAADRIIGGALWDVPGMHAARNFFPTDGSGSMPAAVEVDACGSTFMLQAVEMGDARASRVFVMTNITEEKALNRELERLSQDLESRIRERTRSLSSELEFTQQLLDTAEVLIAVLDHEGHLVGLNAFAERLTRFSRREAETVFSSFVSHPETPLSRIFDIQSTEELTNTVAELPTRDGTKRILSWSTRNLPAKHGHGGKLIIGIDVTDQKQLEAKLKTYNLQLENIVESRSSELQEKNRQLIHTARLATLGEIAAGIAHEMKQPLNVISITADLIKLLMRNKTLTDDLLVSNLDKIRSTVNRLATTITHLQGFIHIDSANFSSVRLPDAVDGALSILGEQIRLDDIDIIKAVPDNLPTIQGERTQMEQVLVNLMLNARDAILEKTRMLEKNGGAQEPKQLSIHGGLRKDGRFVFLEVVDTGMGISKELQDRIFEPFFTTKQADRGTGLGLSISTNIVQLHGGTIELDSIPGKGSTFRVILPVEGGA